MGVTMKEVADLYTAFENAWLLAGGVTDLWRHVWGTDTLGYWYSGCKLGHLHLRWRLGCDYSPDARILSDYFYYSTWADTTGAEGLGAWPL